jgi:hypothetical protein
LMLLLAASCATSVATQKTATNTAPKPSSSTAAKAVTGVSSCPVFYTGRDLPAASDTMRYDDPRATQSEQ